MSQQRDGRQGAFVPGGHPEPVRPAASALPAAQGDRQHRSPYSYLRLTRKAGEGILIGDHVLVTVVLGGHREGDVRLAITAPRHLKILRDELVNPRKLKRFTEGACKGVDDGTAFGEAAVDQEIVEILRSPGESAWLQSALSAALELDAERVADDAVRLMDLMLRRASV